MSQSIFDALLTMRGMILVNVRQSLISPLRSRCVLIEGTYVYLVTRILSSFSFSACTLGILIIGLSFLVSVFGTMVLQVLKTFLFSVLQIIESERVICLYQPIRTRHLLYQPIISCTQSMDLCTFALTALLVQRFVKLFPNNKETYL